MATVFWDSQGVIYFNYLEKGKTVTGIYYAELLGRLDAELQKKVHFHHDKSPAILVELHYEPLSHPPYSPDLVPCDFFVSKLEKVTRLAES